MRPTSSLAALLAPALFTACHASHVATDAPFDWPGIAGWVDQSVPFEAEPGFAGRGCVELRGSPGIFGARTNYGFVESWWLEDAPTVNATILADVVTRRERRSVEGSGLLAGAIDGSHREVRTDGVRAEFTPCTDGATAFVGVVHTIDWRHVGDPIDDYVEVQILDGARGRRAITLLRSPLPRTHAIWNDLRACAATLRAR